MATRTNKQLDAEIAAANDKLAREKEAEQVQKPAGFFGMLSQLTQSVEKNQTKKADPVAIMRAKFQTNSDEAIRQIKSAADGGRWFSKMPDGKFIVCFRNANAVMRMNESTHFLVDSASDAVKVLEAAKTACAAGELDAALLATQRKRAAKAPLVTPDATPT